MLGWVYLSVSFEGDFGATGDDAEGICPTVKECFVGGVDSGNFYLQVRFKRWESASFRIALNQDAIE